MNKLVCGIHYRSLRTRYKAPDGVHFIKTFHAVPSPVVQQIRKASQSLATPMLAHLRFTQHLLAPLELPILEYKPFSGIRDAVYHNILLSRVTFVSPVPW